jgi:hypothetical protein
MKHENPQVSVRLGQTALRNVTEFKYLGIILDKKLTWWLHAEYIQRRRYARVNFMKSIVGQSRGAHPACLLVLYKSTVRGVIEFGGVCFSGMSDCHMRRLEQLDTMEGWMNLLWSNEIYTCVVCGGSSGSPSDKTVAFVFVREPNSLLMVSSIESGTIRTAFPRVRWYRGRNFLRSSTSTWWI